MNINDDTRIMVNSSGLVRLCLWRNELVNVILNISVNADRR